MKRKHLFLAVAALLAVGGFWLARTAWRAPVADNPGVDAGMKTPDVRPAPGQLLRPPDPTRKFRDLSPEERVRRARQGPIGG